MKSKNGPLFAVAGILSIGLLIFGLLFTQAPSPSSPMDEQDPDFLVAASISKETLLLLLAVGIAGVLGMSRRKKDNKSVTLRSKSNRSSDPENAGVDQR